MLLTCRVVIARPFNTYGPGNQRAVILNRDYADAKGLRLD